MSDTSSDTNSFIDEVSEEVRRDRLYALLRRYGWIGVLLVILLVGATAYVEWSKSEEQARAQALGDAIIAAAEGDAAQRVDAMMALVTQHPENAIVALMLADAYGQNDQADQAVNVLQKLADTPDLPEQMRELAQLKLVMVDTDMDAAVKVDTLSHLARAGGAYRDTATELYALHMLGQGDRAGAVEILQTHLQDANTDQNQLRRIAELLVTLGEEPKLGEDPELGEEPALSDTAQ